MTRADDGTIPVGHHEIVAIFEAVRAAPIADSLLALLQFL